MNNTNNWICTDDSSMQHVKNLGDNSFRIIDMIWVNTGAAVEDDADTYIVVDGIVNVDELTLAEIKETLKPFSLGDIYRVYNYNTEVINQIIAECYFESGKCGYDRQSKVISLKEAEQYINNIVKGE